MCLSLCTSAERKCEIGNQNKEVLARRDGTEMCKVWAPRDSVKTGLRESGQEEVKGRPRRGQMGGGVGLCQERRCFSQLNGGGIGTRGVEGAQARNPKPN